MEAIAKRCFVISPIGLEGTEIREHSDNVIEFIIGPAMKELGIHAYRSDHNLSAGKITEQMFKSLLRDDLCIAILTYHNPNVFYELAIAQSAARPTIIMIEKGTAIPFDLHDMRAIEYDFKPRALRDGIYSRQLIEHVRSIEAAGWKGEVPFGHSLAPLGRGSPPIQIHDNVDNFGGEEQWLAIVAESQVGFAAAGISMTRWSKRRFRSVLIEKAQSGCEVRIMAMHPDSQLLPAMINQADAVGNIEAIRTASQAMQTIMSEICQVAPVHFRLLKDVCLHQQIIFNEHRAIVRPHLFSRSTSQMPVIEIARPSQLADAFETEFETLWRRAA